MALKVCTRQEQLDAIVREIEVARKARRDPGSAEHQHYQVLQSIAADIRARLEFPRSNALGDMERAIFQLVRSKTALGYDGGKMNAVAQVVVNKWPTIRAALEQYGEESPE